MLIKSLEYCPLVRQTERLESGQDSLVNTGRFSNSLTRTGSGFATPPLVLWAGYLTLLIHTVKAAELLHEYRIEFDNSQRNDTNLVLSTHSTFESHYYPEYKTPDQRFSVGFTHKTPGGNLKSTLYLKGPFETYKKGDLEFAGQFTKHPNGTIEFHKGLKHGTNATTGASRYEMGSFRQQKLHGPNCTRTNVGEGYILGGEFNNGRPVGVIVYTHLKTGVRIQGQLDRKWKFNGNISVTYSDGRTFNVKNVEKGRITDPTARIFDKSGSLIEEGQYDTLEDAIAQKRNKLWLFYSRDLSSKKGEYKQTLITVYYPPSNSFSDDLVTEPNIRDYARKIYDSTVLFNVREPNGFTCFGIYQEGDFSASRLRSLVEECKRSNKAAQPYIFHRPPGTHHWDMNSIFGKISVKRSSEKRNPGQAGIEFEYHTIFKSGPFKFKFNDGSTFDGHYSTDDDTIIGIRTYLDGTKNRGRFNQIDFKPEEAGKVNKNGQENNGVFNSGGEPNLKEEKLESYYLVFKNTFIVSGLTGLGHLSKRGWRLCADYRRQKRAVNHWATFQNALKPSIQKTCNKERLKNADQFRSGLNDLLNSIVDEVMGEAQVADEVVELMRLDQTFQKLRNKDQLRHRQVTIQDLIDKSNRICALFQRETSQSYQLIDSYQGVITDPVPGDSVQYIHEKSRNKKKYKEWFDEQCRELGKIVLFDEDLASISSKVEKEQASQKKLEDFLSTFKHHVNTVAQFLHALVIHGKITEAIYNTIIYGISGDVGQLQRHLDSSVDRSLDTSFESTSEDPEDSSEDDKISIVGEDERKLPHKGVPPGVEEPTKDFLDLDVSHIDDVRGLSDLSDRKLSERKGIRKGVGTREYDDTIGKKLASFVWCKDISIVEERALMRTVTRLLNSDKNDERLYGLYISAVRLGLNADKSEKVLAFVKRKGYDQLISRADSGVLNWKALSNILKRAGNDLELVSLIEHPNEYTHIKPKETLSPIYLIKDIMQYCLKDSTKTPYEKLWSMLRLLTEIKDYTDQADCRSQFKEYELLIQIRNNISHQFLPEEKVLAVLDVIGSEFQSAPPVRVEDQPDPIVPIVMKQDPLDRWCLGLFSTLDEVVSVGSDKFGYIDSVHILPKHLSEQVLSSNDPISVSCQDPSSKKEDKYIVYKEKIVDFSNKRISDSFDQFTDALFKGSYLVSVGGRTYMQSEIVLNLNEIRLLLKSSYTEGIPPKVVCQSKESSQRKEGYLNFDPSLSLFSFSNEMELVPIYQVKFHTDPMYKLFNTIFSDNPGIYIEIEYEHNGLSFHGKPKCIKFSQDQLQLIVRKLSTLTQRFSPLFISLTYYDEGGEKSKGGFYSIIHVQKGSAETPFSSVRIIDH